MRLIPTGIDRESYHHEHGLPLDLAEEMTTAATPAELHEFTAGAGETVAVLWFPEVRRAACTILSSGTGDAVWTDASSPEDARRRYLDDEMIS